jgi:hypothetical protein
MNFLPTKDRDPLAQHKQEIREKIAELYRIKDQLKNTIPEIPPPQDRSNQLYAVSSALKRQESVLNATLPLSHTVSQEFEKIEELINVLKL